MPQIAESQIKKIEKEAREILGNFSKSLESVKLEKKERKLHSQGTREESSGLECDEFFRRAMFRNAMSKSSDFIMAEKKKW